MISQTNLKNALSDVSDSYLGWMRKLIFFTEANLAVIVRNTIKELVKSLGLQ